MSTFKHERSNRSNVISGEREMAEYRKCAVVENYTKIYTPCYISRTDEDNRCAVAKSSWGERKN